MSKTKIYFIFLFLFSIIPLFDFFNPGLPTTHDGQDHIARITNFYQNLMEGNIIPRWAANLNWGYGHPILMFLYPLPSHIASLFHFLGFSFVDSVKFVFGLAFVLSGVFMFLWVRQFLGEIPGFIAALLYLFAPYRFVDLYVRGAIGEHVAFVFPPLIFYFLLKLSKTTQNLNHSIPPPRSPFGHLGGVLKGLPRGGFWYVAGGSFSVAGLVLSHNAISLMFFPLIFLYALFLLWQTDKSKLVASRYLLVAVLGLGTSAFFWAPAFFEGKYTLRDVVTGGEYASRFVNFQSLLWGEWSYGISGQFTTQVGIIQWFMVILSAPLAILLKCKKNNLWKLITAILIIFWLSLFLMTNQSRFIWETVTMLQKFQFPWRFLSVTVFTTAVLGGLVVSIIPKKTQLLASCFLLLALLFFNKDYWHAKGYLFKPESFYTGIYPSTTDTGESSPIWSVRFMEKEPRSRIEIIEGEASIREMKRTSTYHEYEIEAKNKARIRENTLYFPGWEVFVDGEKTDIEFQDPANRGLMTFFVDKGKHSIDVKFGETKLRFFADVISSVSLVIILFFSILTARKA